VSAKERVCEWEDLIWENVLQAGAERRRKREKEKKLSSMF
jgi:hypothetical protein